MSEDSLQVNEPVISKPTKTVAEAKTETDELISLVYVGPNVPKEGLNRFRVYQGGTPERYDELFKECPAIEKLFVDVEKLSETINLIGKTGSAYHTWYAESVNYIKGV